MKLIGITRILIGMVALFVSVGALAADSTIDGVIVQQRWPWSRLVDIDYVLTCEHEALIDIGVELYDGSKRLDVPSSSFSGDLSGVQRGEGRIVWDPTVTAYTNNRVLPEFRVKLTPTPVPLYMIVDLTQSAGAEDQIDYVYESDLTNGLWGAWVRNPVTNDGIVIESVVWTGVTTNDIYKTDKLVLRRIPKGTFKMGSANPPTISTTLTKNFYAGVFQVTQRQWELVVGEKPSYFNNAEHYMTRPVERVSYNNIRGATNSDPAIDWPGTGTLVEPSSFMGKLREKTGPMDFDLPTDAQWDYVCRAGTTTVFNDGEVMANVSGVNADTNAWLDVLGRYKFNGGYADGVTKPESDCGITNGTAIVGSYLPNAWGLYDMHGNVAEFCLDWQYWQLQGGEDPTGPVSGAYRIVRGGYWSKIASSCRTADRESAITPSYRMDSCGFRLVLALP